MKLKFVKLDPSGNTTAIILDPLPRDLYQKIAAQLLKPESLAVEQVGFLEKAADAKTRLKLQMMGGEFCGNAARAFATWLVKENWPGVCQLAGTEQQIVAVQTSGYSGQLKAIVQPVDLSLEQYQTEITMPLPEYIKEYYLGQNYYLVVGFEGIVHIIAWDVIPSNEQFYFIKNNMPEITEPANCFGVMFYQAAQQLVTPLVYVKKVNSLIWESSCGSGSAAIAAARAYRNKKSVNSLVLKQPRGEITVRADWKGGVDKIYISGSVLIKAEGTVYVNI